MLSNHYSPTLLFFLYLIFLDLKGGCLFNLDLARKQRYENRPIVLLVLVVVFMIVQIISWVKVTGTVPGRVTGKI